MIQIFTLTLAANEAREVALDGEYFEIRNAISDITLIELLDRSGGVISRLSAPEQTDYVKPGRFETIRVTNGPMAQTCKFFVGSGEAGSRRTAGVVKVEDVARAKAIAGNTFQGLISVNVEGQAGVQLYNPAGSGKVLIVNSYEISTMLNGNFMVRNSTVAMGNYQGNAPSKRLQAAKSLAEGRDGGAVAFLDYYGVDFIQAQNNLIKNFLGQPMVIPEGSGIVVYQYTYGSTNFTLNISFDEERA